jgi:hypothetical protein
MTTLKQIMDLNENFELMVKSAPNCPWDEGQKLQEWFLNCIEQWLTQERQELNGDCNLMKRDLYGINYTIDALLEDLK